MKSVIRAYTPPSLREAAWLVGLAKAYFSPFFRGLEKLDSKRPALWVGNHTLYGVLDVPLMGEHLYREHGVVLRALGDRGHFLVPGWRSLLTRLGVVVGSRENCAELMQSGQHVLVFPGGGREVMRRKGEAHQLIWKQRTGFARMAIEHGYDIIPFASLGPDDAMDIVLDANDIVRSAPWRWLSKKFPLDELTRHGDMIPPVARGIGASILPKPQRFYFSFGERISTTQLRGLEDDKASLWQLRQQVAQSIETEMDWLREYRVHDRRKSWSQLRRWLTN